MSVLLCDAVVADWADGDAVAGVQLQAECSVGRVYCSLLPSPATCGSCLLSRRAACQCVRKQLQQCSCQPCVFVRACVLYVCVLYICSSLQRHTCGCNTCRVTPHDYFSTWLCTYVCTSVCVSVCVQVCMECQQQTCYDGYRHSYCCEWTTIEISL